MPGYQAGSQADRKYQPRPFQRTSFEIIDLTTAPAQLKMKRSSIHSSTSSVDVEAAARNRAHALIALNMVRLGQSQLEKAQRAETKKARRAEAKTIQKPFDWLRRCAIALTGPTETSRPAT